MKAIRLHVRDGPEAFTYEDAPQPRPGAGEVLVQVHGAGVTPTELLWLPTWTTPTGERRPFPIILWHEFSREVTAVGEGVADVRVGSPVYGVNDWFRDGIPQLAGFSSITMLSKNRFSFASARLTNRRNRRGPHSRRKIESRRAAARARECQL